MLDSLWSLSYLSAKYSKIARVSLDFDQPSTGVDRHEEDLPNDEVVVMVVDDGGDAAVGVDLQVIWSLVFALAEIEVDRFVRQPELFENDGDFPENRIGFQTVVTFGGANVPAVRSTLVGVQSELLSVGHSLSVVALRGGFWDELVTFLETCSLFEHSEWYLYRHETYKEPC